MNPSNIADIVVIALLLIGIVWGMRSGLVKMLTRVIYSLASFGASLLLYPVIGNFIKTTPIFTILKEKIILSLNLEGAIEGYTRQQEANLISSLNLPEGLKSMLAENNNSVIYDLIDAEGVVDYIAGFIANLIINLLLVWVLFTVFLILLKIVLGGVELLAKLPVINSFNKLGGAIAGLALGVMAVWVAFGVIYIFIANPEVFKLYNHIQGSQVASKLYESNILLDLILERLFR